MKSTLNVRIKLLLSTEPIENSKIVDFQIQPTDQFLLTICTYSRTFNIQKLLPLIIFSYSSSFQNSL